MSDTAQSSMVIPPTPAIHSDGNVVDPIVVTPALSDVPAQPVAILPPSSNLKPPSISTDQLEVAPGVQVVNPDDPVVNSDPSVSTPSEATLADSAPEVAAIEPVAAAPAPVASAEPDPSISPLTAPPVLGGDNQRSVVQSLVEMGALSASQLEELKLEQANTGKTAEALIQEKHLVSEEVLTQARAKFYDIPFLDIESTGVSPEAITLLPEAVARRYHMLPFSLSKANRTLQVAMVNPLDLSAIDFAEKKTGYTIQPYFASPSEVERALSERYAQNLSSEVTEALKETKEAVSTRSLDNLAVLSKEVVREAPITKIVETILAYAMKARASDVHIEPQEDRTRVRYRIDGILAEKLILPRSVHDAVVSRIKILSEMKIDEKRIPQDGRFTFSADGAEVDLRVSTLPTVNGEKVVMRLLQKNASVPSLNDLGLRGPALKIFEEAIRVPHGIVLVTGPTGSGKTTTLYSVLHQINTPKVNISTLEDPVEYQMPGINQVQINPAAGLTFATGLRSFLRQDPNIIMVGEIRDGETVELAVQAALTGHLVFSTLHTNSAAGALPRLMDMGAEPFLLVSTMTLVAGQRVVRKINPDYKEEYQPEPEVLADIQKVLGPLFEAWCAQNKKKPEEVTLFRAMVDRPESEPEYKGRMAIFEVMKVSEAISRLILERKPAIDIEAQATKEGMLLMKQDGYLKALDGITTIEEVLRVAEV
jgi:type IV pilus assembly protein PilB